MQITNLKHLKALCKGKQQLDCYVLLNGCLRSSKTLIMEEGGDIVVVNEIDGTTEDFKGFEDMLKNHSTIKGALEKKAFYVYDYEVKNDKS